MFGSEFYGFSPWWIFPILMVVFCIFMMRGKMGCMMGGHGTHGEDSRDKGTSDSAIDILDRRYALGKINKRRARREEKGLDRVEKPFR